MHRPCPGCVTKRVAVRGLAALACAAMLAACGVGERVSVRPYQPSAGADAAAQSRPAAGQATPRVAERQDGDVHVVRSGETLYAIGRAYEAPLRHLIDLNRLEPPYELVEGQTLRIPSVRVHVVAPGDTVYGLSRQYGVAMNELVRLNDIAPPFRITVGQRLAVPASVEPSVAAAPAPASPPVQAGPVDAPEAVSPPASDVPGEPRPPSRPSPPESAEDRQARPFAVTDAGFPRPRVRPAEPAGDVQLAAVRIPTPPPRASSSFLWPVEGRVIAGFGPAGRGLHNDGINIAAPRGAPVRAAENGVVVYAGDELAGFGQLVLIRHADGYMTAYAHNDSMLVRRGDTVRRGQTIARVGSTGTVDSPQLHFEIRRGRQAIDPLTRMQS